VAAGPSCRAGSNVGECSDTQARHARPGIQHSPIGRGAGTPPRAGPVRVQGPASRMPASVTLSPSVVAEAGGRRSTATDQLEGAGDHGGDRPATWVPARCKSPFLPGLGARPVAGVLVPVGAFVAGVGAETGGRRSSAAISQGPTGGPPECGAAALSRLASLGSARLAARSLRAWVTGREPVRDPESGRGAPPDREVGRGKQAGLADPAVSTSGHWEGYRGGRMHPEVEAPPPCPRGGPQAP